MLWASRVNGIGFGKIRSGRTVEMEEEERMFGVNWIAVTGAWLSSGGKTDGKQCTVLEIVRETAESVAGHFVDIRQRFSTRFCSRTSVTVVKIFSGRKCMIEHVNSASETNLTEFRKMRSCVHA